MFPFPRFNYEQPSLDFEKAHNVSGIAGHYKFHPKRSREHLQERLFTTSSWTKWLKSIKDLSNDECLDVFHELERLNPVEVSKIHFDRSSTDHKISVACGMVSGFNPDDISHFIKRGCSGISCMDFDKLPEGIACNEMQTKIMQRLDPKYRMQWVASPKTLDHIWEQVRNRPIMRPYDIALNRVKENAPTLALTLGIASVGYFVMKERERRKQKMAANSQHILM